MQVESDVRELIRQTHHLRYVAQKAWESGDWQTQLTALQLIVDLAPPLWAAMRRERLKRKVEDAIPTLAQAYAILLDQDRLYALKSIVDSVPEFQALYSVEVDDGLRNISHYKKIYARVEAEPGILQSRLEAPQALYFASIYGIVTRQKKDNSWALTYVGVPQLCPVEIQPPDELRIVVPAKTGWRNRFRQWLRR